MEMKPHSSTSSHRRPFLDAQIGAASVAAVAWECSDRSQSSWKKRALRWKTSFRLLADGAEWSRRTPRSAGGDSGTCPCAGSAP